MQHTTHFISMLKERGISLLWVNQTLELPDKVEKMTDGTTNYLKQISENEGRWLRVIVNTEAMPPKAITVFFDRRIRREK